MGSVLTPGVTFVLNILTKLLFVYVSISVSSYYLDLHLPIYLWLALFFILWTVLFTLTTFVHKIQTIMEAKRLGARFAPSVTYFFGIDTLLRMIKSLNKGHIGEN